MSLLVVGLSHRSAPVELLERAAPTEDAVVKLLHDAVGGPSAAEAVVLATCNRLEVYADVAKFHAGVAELSALLSLHSGIGLDELTPHLYVHYEGRAVHHLYSVACGLDSMVVGESQILGQLKGALQLAQQQGTAGRLLDGLVQQALRVGKRAHTETAIDRAGQSVVSVALEQAAEVLGSALSGLRALVVGAGSMSGLAVATLHRAGVSDIVVANRTPAAAERLATTVGGTAVPLDAISARLAAADLLVSCTGAAGVVIDRDTVAAAAAARDGRPLVVLDLALPKDVDAAARDVPGVTVIDLELLGRVLTDSPVANGVEQARAIVTEEVAAFAAAQRAAQVAPTVVALRSWAADVVDAELARLAGRLPDLDGRARQEIEQAVRRVVDKLLHAPTVRIKQLAAEQDGASYADALRELFDLDIKTVEAVSYAAADAGTDRPTPRAADDSEQSTRADQVPSPGEALSAGGALGGPGDRIPPTRGSQEVARS